MPISIKIYRSLLFVTLINLLFLFQMLRVVVIWTVNREKNLKSVIKPDKASAAAAQLPTNHNNSTEHSLGQVNLVLIMVNFSGDMERMNAIERTCFKEDDGMIGVLAFGEYKNSWASSRCMSPSTHNSKGFIDTKRAFLQALRCFPNAKYIGKFNEDAFICPEQLEKQIEAIVANETDPFYYFGLPIVANGLRFAAGDAYILSRKAAILLLEHCSPDVLKEEGGREDAAVGECMRMNNVDLTYLPGLHPIRPSSILPVPNEKKAAGRHSNHFNGSNGSNPDENEATPSPTQPQDSGTQPDLCIVVTFSATDDDLKTVAHGNTATVYSSLLPRVRAFLAKPVPLEAADWPLGLVEAPETNQYGTPVLLSLLERVRDACPDAPFVAYANSDILFDVRLLRTLDAMLAWNQPELLAVGRRSNHNLQGQLTIDDVTRVPSELFTDVAQDYFIVTRVLVERWRMLPPFVVGRRAYDNALVDWGYHHTILIDLTETVTALHQTTGDGNFAGHSERNPDKEYNAQLPGAFWDHGSTNHAHYASTVRDGDIVIVRRADDTVMARASDYGPHSAPAESSAPEPAAATTTTTIPAAPSSSTEPPLPQQQESMEIQLTSRGKSVGVEALRSPLFVTFGNAAFKEILASFMCNLALFPPMLAHTLVIVTDQSTVDYLTSLDTDVIIGLYPNPIQTGHDYNTPDYVRLMLLRGRLLLQLLGPRVVVWLEADAEYAGNLLSHPQITSATTDLMVYWDGTMYGGGFIRFAATKAARAFYVDVVAQLDAGVARGDFTNDQDYVNRKVADLKNAQTTGAPTFAEFDRCAFRSGTYYQEQRFPGYKEMCKDTRPFVQQHNWVLGNQKKIDMAKAHNAWFLGAETPLPVCLQRDLRVSVMTMDRPASLERLLLSLRAAAYAPGARVDVRVSVDRRPDQPHDAPTLALLAGFEWPHGVFEVNSWPEPVGIYGQWVDSWPCELFPATLYRAAILLEDDLEVSPVYHEWFIGAHAAYASPDLGAVTGMRAQLVAQQGVELSAAELIPAGVQAFAYRLIATWSMSPTHDAWRRFRKWVKDTRANNPGFDPAVDGTVPGQWYREFKASGRESGMWEIWYLRFMHDENLYTLYPWVEDGTKTIVCNWREPGLHYSGAETLSRDFPLVSALPPQILTQSFVPYVDWGLAFYYCLVGNLYGGGTSSQILALAWGQKRATSARKFLRLASLLTTLLTLAQNWDQLFDDSAIPFFRRDGVDDQRCAQRATYEDTYLEMLQARAEGAVLPVPRTELRNKVEAGPLPSVSVHGRSMDGNCERLGFICFKGSDESKVEDICDYSQSRVRRLYGIEDSIPITLFTDGQNPEMAATYTSVDGRPFFEQVWAMVTSPRHIGNPRSSLDFLIALWRQQLGIIGRDGIGGIEPAACYS